MAELRDRSRVWDIEMFIHPYGRIIILNPFFEVGFRFVNCRVLIVLTPVRRELMLLMI